MVEALLKVRILEYQFCQFEYEMI